MSNNTDPELYYRETYTREYYVRATDSSAASSSKELVYNPNYTNNSSSQGSQSSQSSQDSTGSKQGWSGLPYQVTRRGTNDQGYSSKASFVMHPAAPYITLSPSISDCPSI